MCAAQLQIIGITAKSRLTLTTAKNLILVPSGPGDITLSLFGRILLPLVVRLNFVRRVSYITRLLCEGGEKKGANFGIGTALETGATWFTVVIIRQAEMRWGVLVTMLKIRLGFLVLLLHEYPSFVGLEEKIDFVTHETL